MQITNHLEMDLSQNPLPKVLEAVQGDSARAVRLSLKNNGEPWEIPQGATALLRYRNADGTGGVFDTLPDGSPACAISGNNLTVFLPAQALGVAGETKVQAVLEKEGKQLSTFAFSVLTQGAASGGGSGEYTNLSRWLQDNALPELQTYIDTRLGVIEHGAY